MTLRFAWVALDLFERTQEEQANLLGELAMLRNYKHAHLVEFIGTAMAVERGADTVRDDREERDERREKEPQDFLPATSRLTPCGAEEGLRSLAHS